jgi:acyl-CoA synthetase (AMP-forming)/AMP-acid ligase II
MLESELLEALDGTAALGHPTDLLAAVARHHDGRPAFTDHATQRSLTFGGLRDAALRSAHRLRQSQIGRGDVVAFFADDEIDLLPMLLACAGTGVRLVASDAAMPRAAALSVIEQCRPNLVGHLPRVLPFSLTAPVG